MSQRKSKVAVVPPADTAAGANKSKKESSRTQTSSKLSGDDEGVSRVAPYVSEYDFADVFYKPHTLTAMVVLLSSLLAFWKWYYLPGGDVISSIKMGLACAAWAFIVFGMIHLPDGHMVRPHPLFWRLVLSVAVLYMMLIIFLIFQDLNTVKQLFSWYDPIHSVVHPEQSYGDDCRMATPENPYKFWHTIGDIFLIAHSVGYFGKMIVARDWRIVTAISLGFEILEVTFQHQLPNFTECWWDHVIVDIIICNGGGTLVGYLTLRAFGAKQYHWVKLKDIPTLKGKAGRVLKQFTPRSMERFDWHVFESFKRFCQVLLLLAVFFLNELNCFTMKSILNQKANYHLVAARIVFWGFFAIPAVREYYVYISDPAADRLGTFTWVGGMALTVETLFIAKMTFEGGYFTKATPPVIGVCWTIAGTLFGLWIILFFGLRCLQKFFLTRLVLNVLFYGSFVVLALMCCMANVDTQWYLEEFNQMVQQFHLW